MEEHGFSFIFSFRSRTTSAGLKVWRQISILRPVAFLIHTEWMRPQTNLSNPASKHGVHPITITAGRQEAEKKGYEGEWGWSSRRDGFRYGLVKEGRIEAAEYEHIWTSYIVMSGSLSSSCFHKVTVIPFSLGVLGKTLNSLQHVQNSAAYSYQMLPVPDSQRIKYKPSKLVTKQVQKGSY